MNALKAKAGEGETTLRSISLTHSHTITPFDTSGKQAF